MNKLREARVIRRIRQIELQNQSGIYTARISQIENELVKPRDDEKLRLARALGVRPEDLFPEGE